MTEPAPVNYHREGGRLLEPTDLVAGLEPVDEEAGSRITAGRLEDFKGAHNLEDGRG